MSTPTTRIADLPPWFFWAAPETLGSTTEEALRIREGVLDPARREELDARMAAARDQLRDAIPPNASPFHHYVN